MPLSELREDAQVACPECTWLAFYPGRWPLVPISDEAWRHASHRHPETTRQIIASDRPQHNWDEYLRGWLR